MIGRALDSDAIVEPVRGPLIPGFAAVKAAALEAGKTGPLPPFPLYFWVPGQLVPNTEMYHVKRLKAAAL